MKLRPRWSRWALVGAVAGALGAMPVAARPERETPRPPLLVTVSYGDSLWSLARRYGDPERDVREIVDSVMCANHVLPEEMQPGQVLLLPAECLPGGP
jgi:hypothetical protein